MAGKKGKKLKAQGQTKTGTVSVKENRMALCIRK